MIKEYEYLHGVVFNRLSNNYEIEISIKPFKRTGYSSYILNKHVGLYIKYSGKRLSPWRFSLTSAHYKEIQELNLTNKEVFIALVCNLDGIVVLNYKELCEIINWSKDSSDWISISRTKNKMYSVSASDGRLDYKIPLNSCPEKIIRYLKLIN